MKLIVSLHHNTTFSPMLVATSFFFSSFICFLHLQHTSCGLLYLLSYNYQSIGTGESISVWNEPWLKDPICLQPTTEVQVMWDALTVAYLFKPNQKVWNNNFIHYVFDDGTSNQILQTPLLLLSERIQLFGVMNNTTTQ